MDDTPNLKPPKPKPGRKPSEIPKQALNLRLEEGLIRRLKVHALLSGSTVSDVVTELARKHLDFWTLAEVVDPKSKEPTK